MSFLWRLPHAYSGQNFGIGRGARTPRRLKTGSRNAATFSKISFRVVSAVWKQRDSSCSFAIIGLCSTAFVFLSRIASSMTRRDSGVWPCLASISWMSLLKRSLSNLKSTLSRDRFVCSLFSIWSCRRTMRLSIQHMKSWLFSTSTGYCTGPSSAMARSGVCSGSFHSISRPVLVELWVCILERFLN